MTPTPEALFEVLARAARREDGLKTRRHEFAELNQLPVVRTLVTEHAVGLREAVTATLEAGVRALAAIESKSKGLMVGKVAEASMALGESSDVSGLGNRLQSLADDAGYGLSTLRSRHREALVSLAEALPLVQLDDIELKKIEESTKASNYVVEALDIRHVVRRRIPRVSIKDYRVKATGGAYSWHEAQGHYPNDPDEAAFTIRPVSNCSLRDRKPAGTGSHRYELRVPRTNPGRRVEFSYEYRVRSDTEDRPYLRHLAAETIRQCRIGVQFELSDQPDKVWWFANEDSFYEPLDVPPSRQLLKMNEVAYVMKDLPQQQKYDYFGIAWSWKADRISS